jgi:hypothetical protein
VAAFFFKLGIAPLGGLFYILCFANTDENYFDSLKCANTVAIRLPRLAIPITLFDPK